MDIFPAQIITWNSEKQFFTGMQCWWSHAEGWLESLALVMFLSLQSAELTCKREAEREWESVSCMPPLTPQGSSNSEQEQAWATLPQMTETLQVLSIQNGAPGFYSMESVFITLYSFYWDWIFSTEGCEGKREAFNLNLPIFSDMFWSLSGSE